MLALGLFYVGFVLILNALWLLGKVSAKAVVPLNFFVGGLQIAGVLRTVFTGTDMTEYYGAAVTLLFAFTYLYVGLNNTFNLDGRALGWYSLLVALTAVPAGFWALPDIGLAALWWMWATLWSMFFILLALGKNIGVKTGWWTLVNGVATSIAAYFMLIETWPW